MMPAGIGDKDQISACICDLRTIAEFKKTFSSILYNKLEGLTKKKKNITHYTLQVIHYT